jgi:hypothetical protein
MMCLIPNIWSLFTLPILSPLGSFQSLYAVLNYSCLNVGFLAIPCIYAANIYPTPIAAPANAIVAYPAPIYLADIYILISLFSHL